jgi:hypothetical protein
MRPLLIALVLVAAPLAQEKPFDAAQGRPLPDFNTFSAQVRKHLATDEERQSGYVYVERRSEQKVDSSGRQTSESVKTYEIYPGLPGQERYRRLIEEDGRPARPAGSGAEGRCRRIRQGAGLGVAAAESGARARTGPPPNQRGHRRSVSHLRHPHDSPRAD